MLPTPVQSDEKAAVKLSDYPQNFLPAGSIAVSQSSEDGSHTLKGFYDPKAGELHIQEEIIHDPQH